MVNINNLMISEFKDLSKWEVELKEKLERYNYGYTKEIMGQYGFTYTKPFKKNGEPYGDDSSNIVSQLVNSIKYSKTMEENAQKVQTYIENLNIIYGSNPGQYGAYCNGKDLFINKEMLEQYTINQQKIILFTSMIFPLLGLYNMSSKGYYGQAGNYEKGTVVLMCKHLGFGNEKPKYAISTRISGNKTIEGLDIKLPPIELRNETLQNLLNTPNPFFEILVDETLPTNPNKRLLQVKQHFLKMNQGSRFYTETTEITFYVNGNKIMDKKDNEFEDYIGTRLFEFIETPPYKYFKIPFAEKLYNDNNKNFIYLTRKGPNPYMDKGNFMLIVDGYKVITMDRKHPEMQAHLSNRLFQSINDPSQKYFEIKSNEPIFTNPSKRVVKLNVKQWCPYLDGDDLTLFMDNNGMLNNKDKDVSDYILATNVMNALCG